MIRKTLLFLAVFSLATFAHAQFGLYGTLTVDSLGGFPPHNQVLGHPFYLKHVDPIGGTVGAFYDFRTIGPVRLGADVRASINRGTRGAETDNVGAGTRIYSGLAGVRASFRTPIRALKPYVQGSAGLGRSDFGYLFDSSSKPLLKNAFEYHAFAGLDLNLLPSFDFRVVELGYGGLNSFGTDSRNYPLRSISTGIVFHLPNLSILP